MRRQTIILLSCLLYSLTTTAQTTEMTTSEAKSLYKNVTMRRASVHDPSIVYDDQHGYYYIIGSHRGLARTADLQNWTSLTETFGVVRDDGTVETVTFNSANKRDIGRVFRTNQTKTITKDGQTITFGNYDAEDWTCAIPAEDGTAWSIDGVMWAPDIIWNPQMQKWCQYMGLNGNGWNSVVVLLTADQIEGPWIYQGPVVYSGFRNTTNPDISWKKTDLELVLGELSTLPARYNKPTMDNGQMWGDWWPNNIDPCVFFDEEGELWMIYGSWSGGIYMLRLNKANGLRDYDVTYASDYDTKGKALTSDAYFGKRIAGGCYVSGEGPYIEHIGQYYYLFMSYGGFAPDGGYQMRVFRSEQPDGPYVDPRNQAATYTSWQLNYGPNTSNRGQLLMSSYNQWGFQTVGECAQGHNSVLAAPDGRTYLVYHTKFNNGTAGHQVRVHQLFLNEQGWLTAAPFEYNGETQTDQQNATEQLFAVSEVPGTWQLLVHKYGLNHENMEEVVPVEVTLAADGTISGGATGRWELVAGTTYVHITLSGVTYYGVLTEQQLEPTTIKALCFTALSAGGVPVWGYKIRERYQLARQINTQSLPIGNGRRIAGNVDLYGIDLLPNVNLQWESTAPEVLSPEGRYNPAGLDADLPLQLSLKEWAGDYYYKQTYNVTARKDSMPDTDFTTGMLAYYNFDSRPVANILNPEQTASMRRQSPAALPTLNTDTQRNGSFLRQYTADDSHCSYTQFDNPFAGRPLDEGITLSFWLKRYDSNLERTVWAFYQPSARTRLSMTPNAYFCYSEGNDTQVEINNPSQATGYLAEKQWNYVTITLSRTGGIAFYVDGQLKPASAFRFSGTQDGASISRQSQVDFDRIVSFLASCQRFYLGYGTSYGSADVGVDDLMFYERVLSAKEIRGLYMLANRVFDFANALTDGIETVTSAPGMPAPDALFDLSGRRVTVPTGGPGTLPKGLYIGHGRKFVVN